MSKLFGLGRGWPLILKATIFLAAGGALAVPGPTSLAARLGLEPPPGITAWWIGYAVAIALGLLHVLFNGWQAGRGGPAVALAVAFGFAGAIVSGSTEDQTYFLSGFAVDLLIVAGVVFTNREVGEPSPIFLPESAEAPANGDAAGEPKGA